MTLPALRRIEESGTQARAGAEAGSPLRLLLLRDRGGELPWLVQTITRVMAPVELVEVRNLANAVWRLGRERFDTVLLDLVTVDRSAADVCRRHIGDVAAVPVLDLNDDADAARAARSARPARPASPPRRVAPPPEPVEPQRPMLWPPRVGKRRGAERGGLRPALEPQP